MRTIERIEARRLEIPLERPYRLAFGPVDHYDTIVVELVDGDGQRGFGEATLLTGYTDETIGEAWQLARELVRDLAGRPFADASARVRKIGQRSPFVATAFHTALDLAARHALLHPDGERRVPILGLLQGADEAELRSESDRLVAEGYRTVKVKIGFDLEEDVAAIERVQKVVDGRARIRIDANQGYNAAQAVAFVRGTDPAGIELFEQPCGAGDWEAHKAVAEAAAKTGLPLMLDESIFALGDIDRAAREHACIFLKVKLMKFVSIDGLVAAIERIRSLGMQPVLGNGVACDPSCWMEACVAAAHIDNAGEMNGFLKARRMLFERPLRFEDGHLVLEAGSTPALDRDALHAYTRDHAASHPERFA